MRSSFDLAPRSTRPKRELAKRLQNHRVPQSSAKQSQ